MSTAQCPHTLGWFIRRSVLVRETGVGSNRTQWPTATTSLFVVRLELSKIPQHAPTQQSSGAHTRRKWHHEWQSTKRRHTAPEPPTPDTPIVSANRKLAAVSVETDVPPLMVTKAEERTPIPAVGSFLDKHSEEQCSAEPIIDYAVINTKLINRSWHIAN